MGANVAGSDAFTKDGVDLSKTGGLAIDTNAPVSSSDLGNIEDKVAEAAQDAKDKKNEFENAEKDFWQQLNMLKNIILHYTYTDLFPPVEFIPL